MLSAHAFRELISGRRRGPVAAMLRACLGAAEVPYSAAVRLRNYRFDSGRAAIHRLPVPVISVGNLTLGGTGKTPVVAWLARWLQTRGLRGAIVSRGYGSAGGELNDEGRELGEKLPGVPHFQHPDRVLAARRAIDEAGAQCIVLDDGFQHRRLARDLDIVLIDACEPYGFEHVFPRGTLREPLDGCRRAQVLALSRADMLSPTAREAVRRRFATLAPQAAWLELEHQPRGLRSASGSLAGLITLAGRRVAAFCGIGNPAGFRHVLESCGCDLVALREFADHHRYDAQNQNSLADWATASRADVVVCTHKDLVKLPVDSLGGVPLWAVTVDVAFGRGQSELESLLTKLTQRSAAAQAAA